MSNMREDDALMLGVRAMVEDVREGVMVAFMEAWKDSCLEGDNFWKAVSMLDILIVVVVGMGVLGLDEGQEMVGTCKDMDMLLVEEEGVLAEEDDETVTLL